MLSFEPNIIFIDDKKEEVIDLVDLYRQEGIGCKFYNADISIGDHKPVQPYSDVNLIFLDLYYKKEFDVELCTGWIESLIPVNSFYVLVIWSKDTQHRSEVEEDLINLNRKPYIIFEFQKGEGYKNPDNTWDFVKLYCDIEDKVRESYALEELGLWKKSITNSSNTIIGHLAKDLLTSDLLTKKLQKIVIGHGGTIYISPDNQEQKREVLFDALDNILISNSKISRIMKNISKHNSENLYNINAGIESDIDTKLNSWFHFKLHKDPIDQEKIQIGLISKFNNKFLKNTYSLLNDSIVTSYLSHQIDAKKMLTEVVLLISRPCDIAQKKYGKNFKLISGVIIKNPIRKENPKKEIRTGQKVDSIKLYDHLSFSDEDNDNALIFDFRYVFSVPEDTFFKKFINMKIFNKELLSEMQVEYSAYSSRLGITQII